MTTGDLAADGDLSPSIIGEMKGPALQPACHSARSYSSSVIITIRTHCPSKDVYMCGDMLNSYARLHSGGIESNEYQINKQHMVSVNGEGEEYQIAICQST
jgi:hypothetical protein